MNNTRSYFVCPKCEWHIQWSFIPPKPDPDMGLVIAAHIEACHPEMIGASRKPNLWRADLERSLGLVK